MVDLVVFNILIPLTDDRTGETHPIARFDGWVSDAVRRFGGLTIAGVALEGFWHDPERPPGSRPVVDHSNSYTLAVAPDQAAELRSFVEETARRFGQKCIYLERTGTAEFIWDPARRTGRS